MIARLKKPVFISNSGSGAVLSLPRALRYIRHIKALHIKQLSPLLLTSVLIHLAETPSSQLLCRDDLYQDLKQAIDLFISDLLFQLDGVTLASNWLMLGPYLLLLRIYRDIRNSTASRKDRLLAAIRLLAAKAHADSLPITDILGLPVMYGAYI